MGKAISTMIQQVDRADQKQQEQLQTLEMLRSLAITKQKLWLANIDADVGTRKKFFADVLISQEFQVMAEVSSQDNIGPAIEDVIKGFTDGDLVKGISNTISKVFSKLIQTTASGETEKYGDLTILGSMGSVARVDYYGYLYNFVNYGLEKKSQKVLLWTYIVSAVNVTKIENQNAFKVLIDMQYKDLDLKEKEELLTRIHKGLDKALAK